MKPHFLANMACWCALAGAMLIGLLTLVGALATPGYSHVSQYISELGATGALHETWVRFGGFMPAGVLIMLSCLAAHAVLPAARSTTLGLVGIGVYALGYVVAAFLPCDPGCRPAQPSLSQAIHNTVGLLGYVGAPCVLFLLARNARSWPQAQLLVRWGYVGAALALAGLLTLSPKSPWAGLSQRTIEAAVLSWIVVSGLYLRKHAGRI